MKLSKEKSKFHNQACELLKKDVLTYDDKIFVLSNWQEGASSNNGDAGAFFTPNGLARDFQLSVTKSGRVIDLCAGIGMLSFWFLQYFERSKDIIKELVCVEINPQYVEVGKKIVPEATWICGSVLNAIAGAL